MRINDWSSDVCSSDLFRLASLTPLAGVSASKNDPLPLTLIRLPIGHDGGWMGDEGRGHACTDPARLSGAGQGDQGDRARVARLAEHGAQGSALGGDAVQLRPQRTAPSDARPVAGRSGPAG